MRRRSQSLLRHRVWLLLGLFALQGCAGLTQPRIDRASLDAELRSAAEQRARTHAALRAWTLRGTLAMQEGERYTSARMLWQQRDRGVLDLRVQGGLGAGALRLAVEPHASVLWVDGEELHAPTPEALLQERLGLNWPVSYLEDWIRAVPRDGQAVQATRYDMEGNLSVFEQAAWRIEVVRRDETSGLPKRLRLTPVDAAAAIVLELAGLRWQLNASEPSE